MLGFVLGIFGGAVLGGALAKTVKGQRRGLRAKVGSMNSRLLMTLQVAVVGAQKIGEVPHGARVTAPIASGHFEGPRLRGKVLPGGGDWTLLRADGVLELDLRITLETDDGALIHMASFGLLSMGRRTCSRRSRAARAGRPLDLLLPDHAALRDRAPEIRVLESPPRRVERRSTRRGSHLHDRRDLYEVRGPSTRICPRPINRT